jgi:hypothetical protein
LVGDTPSKERQVEGGGDISYFPPLQIASSKELKGMYLRGAKLNLARKLESLKVYPSIM